MTLLLAVLLQSGELDALGHPDPERRLQAEEDLRRRDAAALPLLREGLSHPDPEVRARAADVVRRISPLAWTEARRDPELLDLLRPLLASPAPPEAARLSRSFLIEALPGPGSVAELLGEAPAYQQAVLLLGGLHGADLAQVQASACPTGPDRPDDVVFLASEGVIWAGYRRELAAPPDLLAWLLSRLDDPQARLLLVQMLPPRTLALLLEDPRPEAVDLLVVAHALRGAERLDPRLAPRLAGRLDAVDRGSAAAWSILLRKHAAELGSVLDTAAGSANRWARYLAAALAAQHEEARPEAAAFNRLLRDPEPRIRHEAVRAVLKRVKAEAWDCAALLEAVENLATRDVLLQPLRESWNPRLQAAAVESLRRTPEASLAVLEDCDDAGILDAAAVAFRAHPDPSLLARSTSVLRRTAEAGDPWAKAMLISLFDGGSADEGARAAYALGGLPAGDILGFLEERLATGRPGLRERALQGIQRVGSRVEPDSCLAESLRGLLTQQAERTADLQFRLRLLEAAEAPAFRAYAPHRVLRRMVVRGCGFRTERPQGGWRPLPSPSVPLPAW